MVTPKLKTTPTQKNKNIFITSLEDQLAQSLGLPAKIKLKSTQSGQLLLPFANQEELNRIINKLL